MLVFDQGMQQKLSNSWKLGCKTEYEGEMPAEDGESGPGVTSTSPPSLITNGGGAPGSIVNSLLLKKTGAYFNGDSSASSGSGLEQKIKELKAEKQSMTNNGDLVKTKCPGSLNDQDSPIDFSVKRRSSFSGSLSDDSQGSSCSPPNTGDYRGLSPPHDFTNTINSDTHNGDVTVKHELDSFYEDPQPELIGQPRVSIPSSLPSLLNGMGALSGIQSSLLTNGSSSTINNFSQVISAANKMNDTHKNNRKNSRPFKAYPKEALQLPLGFLGMPGFAALQQGLESGIFAGMSSDEIMTLYNQQLQMFKDKQLSSSTTNSGKSSPPSQISSTTSSTTENHLNGHQHHLTSTNNHLSPSHHQHSPPHPNANSAINNKLQIHSPGLVPPSPPHSNNGSPQAHINSPPHFPAHLHNNISPDHLKVNGLTTSSAAASINNPFPVPHLPNSSLHASNTLVSSTSPSSTSPFNNFHGQSNNNNSNSRKRPRSLPDEQKDDAYWERRRKNNDAAKRSRDARRAKEDEIALRAALLEQENLKLRVEVAALKTETARLRCMLYNT